MSVKRIVPNIPTDDPALGRAFFGGLLGLNTAMDLGWIVTYASPTNPAAQVSVVRGDPSQPSISVEVDDVDRIHAEAVAMGFRIAYPLTDEPWGVRRFFVEGPGGVIVNVLSHSKPGE